MYEQLLVKFPRLAQMRGMREYILYRARLQAPLNTLLAICHDCSDYASFCEKYGIDMHHATRDAAVSYVEDLSCRPSTRRGRRRDSQPGLTRKTQLRRLSVLRGLYEYLIDERYRKPVNPFARLKVRRGVSTVPWIPNETQWDHLIEIIKSESLRNRAMFATAYDLAARSNELCNITLPDINSAKRSILIRAEVSKSRSDRTLPISEMTNALLVAYQCLLPATMADTGPIFLSESPRNHGASIAHHTWRKVVQRIRTIAKLPNFHAHTLRHLSLTDLARGGMDVLALRAFAGHRSIRTTQVYIHLAAADIEQAYARANRAIRERRLRDIGQDQHER